MYKPLTWTSPENYAAALLKQDGDCVFLHSSTLSSAYGTHSYIAYDPIETIEGDDWPTMSLPNAEMDTFPNAWFGYLSYELLHDIEDIPETLPSPIALPRVWLMKPRLVIAFNHFSKECGVWFSNSEDLTKLPPPILPEECASFSIEEIESTMSKENYLSTIKDTVAAIHRGDFFQANITRKFWGKLSCDVAPFSLYCKLTEKSPACYSSFIRKGSTSILSSSPEQFLRITPKGIVESRPIKGTSPRGKSHDEDLRLKENLLQSGKNLSENLMIIDLVRNDLAKVCRAGTVKVKEKFALAELKTLFHLYSTISGELPENTPILELVKSAFPPGSMTGAPKVEVMKHCASVEKLDRGVYSGAIGYLAENGQADLSVVIRTILLKEDHFEFQVGGGIVAESDPTQEWEETLHKAKGIGLALGFDPFESLGF